MTKPFRCFYASELFGRSILPVFNFNGSCFIKIDKDILLEGIIIRRLKFNTFNGDGMRIKRVKP